MNRRFACKTVSIVLLLTVLASCFLGWMRVGGDISVSPVRLAVISSKTVKFQEELSLAGETAEKLEPALKAIFVGQLLFLILLAILVLHTLVMHLLDRRYKGIPIFTALLGVALLPVIFTIALDGFSIAYGLYLGFGAALLSVVFWSLAGQSEQEEEIPTVAVWKPSADYAPPRTCPNCGASVDAKRTFCTACGASMTPPTAKVRICAGCGAPLEEGSAFCTVCGASTAPPAERPPRLCAGCGAPIPPDASFCVSCGRSLHAGDEPTCVVAPVDPLAAQQPTDAPAEPQMPQGSEPPEAAKPPRLRSTMRTTPAEHESDAFRRPGDL